MINTKTQIKQEIVNHMRGCESNTRKWYVGIAADPEKRLFNDHNVSKEYGCWIHRDAGSHESARKIEKEIINEYGTQGGDGGGDYRTRHVYAYKITSTTKQ